MTSSTAAAGFPPTHHDHTHSQLFPLVFDHFLIKSSRVFSSQRHLISPPQKRKLHRVVNDRNKGKTWTLKHSLQTQSSVLTELIWQTLKVNSGQWMLLFSIKKQVNKGDNIVATTVRTLFHHWPGETGTCDPHKCITNHNCSQFTIHSLLVRSLIIHLGGLHDNVRDRLL